MVFQFIPAGTAPLMARLTRSLNGTEAMAVLDLEDGCRDPFDPARTIVCKVEGRHRLIEMCPIAEKQTTRQPVAMRLNAPGTAEFERDLPIAQRVTEVFELAIVLLPKITAPEDLSTAHQTLHQAGIRFGGLVPMIETVKGMNHLAPIIATAKQLGAPAILYGYHDYCLDAGYWPFLDLEEKAYWEIVEHIARPTLAAGLRYIHPPQVDLHDRTRLGELIAGLHRLCGEKFDILSAGMSQTTILRELLNHPAPPISPLPHWRESPVLDVAEKRRLAREICDLFAAKNRAEHSFAADARKGRFISPHEYFAAKRYLQGGEGA